ncbi:MAG: hypothetical protein WC081_05805 [Candidatus Ratteibacteria bacterium]|jgi:hypothetical protein
MKIDRKFVILAIVVFYFLVIRFAIVPNWQAAGKFKKETADLNKSLNSLVTLNAGYLSARGGLEAALHREGSTGIISAAQNKTQEMGFAEKLKSVTPVVRDLNGAFRLEGYDLRLEEVSLKEAVLFSESMQKEEGFYLDRIVLEKSKDGMSLLVRLRVLTIKKL